MNLVKDFDVRTKIKRDRETTVTRRDVDSDDDDDDDDDEHSGLSWLNSRNASSSRHAVFYIKNSRLIVRWSYPVLLYSVLLSFGTRAGRQTR